MKIKMSNSIKETYNMKVIFLDIDGVLCTYRTGVNNFDIYETRWLNWFCNKHDIKIVISSSWRIGTPKDWFDLLFGENLHEDWKTGRDPKGRRGNEIKEWLKEHSECKEWAIIDDETVDMLETQKMFAVKTNFWQGFCFQNRLELIEIFGLDVDENKIGKIGYHDTTHLPNFRDWCDERNLKGLSE